MRLSAAVLLLILAAVPLFAADDEVTLPVVGYLQLSPDLIYRTEFTVTNHRNARQLVELHLISDGSDDFITGFTLNANETKFLPGFPQAGRGNFIGALRVVAMKEHDVPDPEGRIDAKAFIVAEHPISRGETRQEIEAVAQSEYFQAEAVFLGARHSMGTGKYTNVGIANLDATRSQTFVIEYERVSPPVTVTVAPLSTVQVRITGPGVSYRALRVRPTWAMVSDGGGLPWVAYSSTVDTHTGDAFSGMRVPAGSYYDFIQ
jgi:hypothetical protein